MSMISEQIKKLQNISEELETNTELDCSINDYRMQWAQTIDSAIDTIKTLSVKVVNENMIRSSQYYHHGWIPCNEHMPQEYGNYLATLDDGDVEEVTWHDKDMRWSVCEANGYREMRNYEAIAWMPLPEPYVEN